MSENEEEERPLSEGVETLIFIGAICFVIIAAALYYTVWGMFR